MLDQKTINDIVDHAAVSDLAKVNWAGRGRAPIGYIKGLACTYGLCLQKLAAKDSAALAMVRVVDGEHDVFDHYEGQLIAAGLETNAAPDVERLRALFVVLTGLGMRESSGRYCCGRDTTAKIPPSSDTVEAGLFQQSWDSRRASPEIEKIFHNYNSSVPDAIDGLFKVGVTPQNRDLENVGSGDGYTFQALCKAQPTFAVQVAAIGLRTLYIHWGPIVRREVEIRPEAIALFRQVEELVGAPAPGVPVAEALIGVFAGLFGRKGETKPTVDPPALDLPSRIVAAMLKRGFRVDIQPGQVNTVYIEGMGPDGTKNDNRPNEFNDARFVIGFDGGESHPARILGAWEATTEPSAYWSKYPMHPGGAFHIDLDQQTAWRVDIHHAGTASAHEALCQFGIIKGSRDKYKTGKRDMRFPTSGDDMGINQHWGYDLPHDDLGHSSAGCLVGRMRKGHEEFMRLVKSDPRYIADHKFIFTAAVLPSSEV